MVLALMQMLFLPMNNLHVPNLRKTRRMDENLVFNLLGSYDAFFDEAVTGMFEEGYIFILTQL